MSAIEDAMEHVPAPGWRKRAYWVSAAAAGVAVWVGLGAIERRSREPSEPAVGHLFALFGPPPAVLHGRDVSSPAGAAGGLPVAFDSHLDTGLGSSSRLMLASGVEIAVGADTHMALPHAVDRASGREEVELAAGLVRVDVPKLRQGHTFAIHTPDTWVTVHGTSFSVEVSAPPSGHVRTSVDVAEGVVTVQTAGEPEIFLTAGARWVSTPESTSRSSAPDLSPEARLASGPEAQARPSPTALLGGVGATLAVIPSNVVHPSPAVQQTALAEQNRLFAEAMAAREHGDGVAAIRMLESFIHAYPASPLAEDAYVELLRSFVQMRDRAAAARMARRYLAIYGEGFARDEARELALEPGAATP